MQGYNICSFCGSSDSSINKPGELYCSSCTKTTFINPATAAGCYLVDSQGNIGLAKRAHDPRKGHFDEAGGFTDLADMSCEETVIRELYEELGIQLQASDMHYLGSHSIRYFYQGRDTPVMCIFYYAYISDEQKALIVPNDDVECFQWFSSTTFDSTLMCSESQADQVNKIFEIISHAKH